MKNLNRVLMSAALVTALSACAVMRGQESVGEYSGDAVITTKVKAEFASSPEVAATAIGVETLNGTVQLSGFTKDPKEKERAGEIAKGVKGVKLVKNDILVRP